MLEDRKAFNFYRSYYEVAVKLEKEYGKDHAFQFLMAVLECQFNGGVYRNLSGISEFAFTSQRHSIEQQVKGYANKKGLKDIDLTIQPPSVGGSKGASVQVEGEGEGEGEGKVQVQEKDKHLNALFETFWNAYDKKVNKPKCEKKFKSLSIDEITDIINHVPAYVKSTPDKKFRKDPLTYLNNRAWEDEITKSSGGIRYESWYRPGDVEHIII